MEMTEIMRKNILFVLLIFLTSCLVEEVPRNMRKSKLSTKKTPAKNPTFGSAGELYWYTSQNNGKLVSISRENTSIVYLRGRLIHDFLKYKTNAAKKYCIVSDFILPDNTKTQLRVQAIPITFTNFSNQTLERLLRLDLKSSSESKDRCSGDLPFTENNIISSTVISSTNPATGTAATSFQNSDICPSCSTQISSSHISLYEENTDTNGNIPLTKDNKVSKEKLSLLGFGIEILSPNISSQIGDSRCNNSTCKATGFDCCLNNQCVNDGGVKPGASSYPDYDQALQDVISDSKNKVFYPHIYYICPNYAQDVPSTPPSSDNNLEQAQWNFKQDGYYYDCLEEGKKDTPDFVNNNVCSTSDPSADSYPYLSYLDSSKQTTVCYGEQPEDCHKKIRDIVWKRCGCKADPLPESPDNLLCPNYSLRPIKNLVGTILRFECEVPNIDPSETPFQELEIKLNGRTTPHRFFKKTDGSSVDDMTSFILSTDQSKDQEGDIFFYQDNKGKTEPEMSAYSMNAILGPINVSLDAAVPAKVLNVEYDRQYIISAIKGFFTPCPQCKKDTWLSSLTAYPFSQNGKGIQAAGYSTKRYSYENNISNGNYEDTIFGRACWLPPTMIAFSHVKNPDLQTQRKNRLETQAALFINGYQRDWYGFNKGSIVGSFDGVSWFSIGNGRRVTSTSTKLFLAFNAPFADLSDPTSTTVSVMVDLGSNSVSQFDYNPSLGIDHPEQNKGGSCRQFHQCVKDFDCVAKLGWEYSCADVSKLVSSWPKFDKDSNEVANEQIDKASFSTILSKFPPSGSTTKRCVYRGAGSLCKRNFKDDLDKKYQKLFTCAPNFYCASYGDNVFNDKVMRVPNLYSSIQYGQQANTLGRPEKYVGATAILPDSAKSSIIHHASLYSSDTSDFGLCRPGKKIITTTTTSPVIDQHQNPDSQKRTDYISQISSCDETSTGANRVITCPLFERDIKSINYGNYITDITGDNSNNLVTPEYQKELHYQNSCGGESIYNDKSTFERIEAKRIDSLAFLEEQTLVGSACLRRAGSICHTDLDCTPNILHEREALTLDKSYFGNTDAEHDYWKESLVCGQAQKQPSLTDYDYEKYDMTKNRCCREVGKDITIYTQYKKGVNDPDLIPEQGTGNDDLSSDTLPHNSPSTDGRYSRFSIIDFVDATSVNDATPDPYSQLPILRTESDGTPDTPKQFQWKTIHETARRSCCGGGWIRKFADDTNDWTQNPRINFDVAAFSCLNYMSPVSFYPPTNNCSTNSSTSCLDSDAVSTKNYNKDVEKLCLSPEYGGCIQVSIPSVAGYELSYPTDSTNDDTKMDTTPTETPVTGSPVKQLMSFESPYMPTPYANPTPIASSGPYNYFATRSLHDAVSFYLPIYIGGKSNINSVSIKYVSDQTTWSETAIEDPAYCDPTITPNKTNPRAFSNPERWCIETLTNGYQIFHIKADQSADNPDPNENDPWNYAGVEINFNPIGTTIFKYDPSDTGPSYKTTATSDTRLNPGNALYYLTKLSRFELMGIPQIFYEPIYCNTDRSQLVENIFSISPHTRTQFEKSGTSFQYDRTKNYSSGRSLGQIYDYETGSALDQTNDISNPDGHIVLQDKVMLGKVFSPHKFKCCMKLGETAPSKESCCSNYTVSEKNEVGQTVEVCKLPPGTNLNVYFNRFVSGEGHGKTLPAGGLSESNYIPETGEPKLNRETFNKLEALGREYCYDKKIRRGAAFGYFYPEPNSGFFEQEQTPDQSRKYSIIDSVLDSDTLNDTGTTRFLQGFRWNHHIYCQ